MKTMKKAYPELSCMVFDLPEVVSRVPEKPENIEFVTGNFFEPATLPKVDMLILKRILHDWGDEDCIKILKACCTAVATGAKVLVVDIILPDAGEAAKSEEMALDVTMMLLLRGRERTLSEWKKMFHSSGLQFVRVVPGYHLIETVKI